MRTPSDMYDIPPFAIYPDLFKIAGLEAIVQRADEFINIGEPVKALHLTDIVLESDPNNEPALEARINALRLLCFKCKNEIEFQYIINGMRAAYQKIPSTK